MPIVTISRMFGSGGSEVAARIAAALGWSLLDNAFVDRVASRLRTTPAMVEAIQERVPSLARRVADVLTLGSPEMLPGVPEGGYGVTEERVLDMTRRVLDETVAQGPLVVVGRGAQMALAERADAIHVFCYAPAAALAERIAARESIPLADARQRAEKVNREREQYVHRHWQRNWRSVEHYHLCLDTAWLGIDGAAQLVVDLARARFTNS